jgi:DNA-binding transcriptional ArsR family regulator
MEDGETRRGRDPERVERARATLPREDGEAAMNRVRRVVCDPVRSRIVWTLAAGPLSVDDLATVIGRTAAGTSQHLRVLRDLGIVESTKAGRTRYYRLTNGGDGERVVDLLRAFQAAAA